VRLPVSQRAKAKASSRFGATTAAKRARASPPGWPITGPPFARGRSGEAPGVGAPRDRHASGRNTAAVDMAHRPAGYRIYSRTLSRSVLPCPLLGRAQAIADAGFGENMLWALRI